MKTISQQLDAAFRKAIKAAFDLDADPQITPSANDKFGDYQANAAMGLAKLIHDEPGKRSNPRVVAEKIVANLQLGDISDTPADKSWIAGPGFINVKISPKWLSQQLAAAAKDDRLGVEKTATPQTVVVDYSGPNIAKELHVGHLRSTIIGDACSRVLEFQGDNVIRQNHLGDWGTQFGMLIASFPEGPPEAITILDLDKFYKAARQRFEDLNDFADEARKTVVRLQSGAPKELQIWNRIIDLTRQHFEPIYRRLGVKLTRSDERGESFYNALLPQVVADLQAAGVAAPSEGAIAVFTPGDKAPLIVQKQDGGFGYATTDLAAIRFRVKELHANRIIYFVGAPQSQHFRQVFATAEKMGWADGVALVHAEFGSVLGEDRKMFKARKGKSVKLAELLDEAEERALTIVTEKSPQLEEAQRQQIAAAVGIGGVKYSDLTKDRISDYVFSFDAMLAMDGNTAPYMQYAYARVRSIFRRAAERGITFDVATATFHLDTPQELSLAKHILRFGEVIEQVARELKPHVLCAYLYDLAGRFSSFFEACPVLTSEEPIRSSRLALADLTAKVLGKGLDLLGIQHPEQM